MLDYLDSLTDAPLFARGQPARREALQVAALGCGLAEKGVSLFYERRLHDKVSPQWEARCIGQIGAGITLSGYGGVSQSSVSTVINNGTLVGNSASTFTINPNVFTNSATGTVRATLGTTTHPALAFTDILMIA